MDLVDHIARESERPFVWGEADCATFVAGWVSAVSGIDVMASLGPVRSASEAAKEIAAAGGYAAGFRSVLRRAGWRRLKSGESARAGDVGLVVAETPAGPDTVAAIRTAHGWAVKCRDGVAVLVGPARVVFRAGQN